MKEKTLGKLTLVILTLAVVANISVVYFEGAGRFFVLDLIKGGHQTLSTVIGYTIYLLSYSLLILVPAVIILSVVGAVKVIRRKELSQKLVKGKYIG